MRSLTPKLTRAQLLAGLEASPGFVTVKRHLRVRQTFGDMWKRRPAWPASENTSAYWPRLAALEAALSSIWRWRGMLEGAWAAAPGRLAPTEGGAVSGLACRKIVRLGRAS